MKTKDENMTGVVYSPVATARDLRNVLDMNNLKKGGFYTEIALYALRAIVLNPWDDAQIVSAIGVLEELPKIEKDSKNAYLITEMVLKISNIIIEKRPDLAKRLDRILDVFIKDNDINTDTLSKRKDSAYTEYKKGLDKRRQDNFVKARDRIASHFGTTMLKHKKIARVSKTGIGRD